MKIVDIYTDGACKGNPGNGGWGAILICGSTVKEIYGGENPTTNNRMELTAAIKAIELLNEKCIVNLYTDSKYLQQGILEWLDNWIRRNWRSSTNAPVKNQDLWEKINSLRNLHEISWHWVRGHNGNKYNEIADQLANKGIAFI